MIKKILGCALGFGMVATAAVAIAGSSRAWAADSVPTAPSAAPGVSSPSTPAPAWQGAAPEDDFQVGFLTGLALIEPHYGFGVLGHVAKRVVKDGWLADVSDAVYLEGTMGTVFVKSQHPFVYSLALRWDFQYNESWNLYALGGVGGQVSGPELGDRSLIFLRTGLGAFYSLRDNMKLRVEVSHEWISTGLTFGF
jgi:hypothetical protein